MRAPRPYISRGRSTRRRSAPSAPFRALKQFGLVLLCAAWVALGIAGHDPWKTEDATSIGVATEMADSDDFVVPHAGAASRTCRGRRSPTSAARSRSNAVLAAAAGPQRGALVVGVALALVLLATAFASRELNGRAFRWLPVLILVGSVGFWDRAHVLSPELFLTLGVADRRCRVSRSRCAGRSLGGSRSAPASRSRSWATDSWARCGSRVTALLLPACGPEWRNRAYVATLAVALAVAAWRCRCRGRSRCTRATRRCSRSGSPSESPGDYFAFLGDGTRRAAVLPAQPRLVRVARAAAAAVAAVAARARLQRRPARARHRHARACCRS